MKIVTLMVAMCWMFTACSGGHDPEYSELTCVSRPSDTTGYLESICQHIVSDLGTYNVDPNTLSITRVTLGSETGSSSIYATADYDWVELDCCFTGDTAILDRETKVVVEFQLGDV